MALNNHRASSNRGAVVLRDDHAHVALAAAIADRIGRFRLQGGGEGAQQVVATGCGVTRQVGCIAMAQADREVARTDDGAGVDDDRGRASALQVDDGGVSLGG